MVHAFILVFEASIASVLTHLTSLPLSMLNLWKERTCILTLYIVQLLYYNNRYNNIQTHGKLYVVAIFREVFYSVLITG
jgi:hypothetical protein